MSIQLLHLQTEPYCLIKPLPTAEKKVLKGNVLSRVKKAGHCFQLFLQFRIVLENVHTASRNIKEIDEVIVNETRRWKDDLVKERSHRVTPLLIFKVGLMNEAEGFGRVVRSVEVKVF